MRRERERERERASRASTREVSCQSDLHNRNQKKTHFHQRTTHSFPSLNEKKNAEQRRGAAVPKVQDHAFLAQAERPPPGEFFIFFSCFSLFSSTTPLLPLLAHLESTLLFLPPRFFFISFLLSFVRSRRS